MYPRSNSISLFDIKLVIILKMFIIISLISDWVFDIEHGYQIGYYENGVLEYLSNVRKGKKNGYSYKSF
jgi:hypothetical protein